MTKTHTRGRLVRPAGLLLAIAALAGVLRASGPTFWTQATASDFLKGTSNGVYVSLSGFLTPGPPLTSRLGTSPAQVWSLAAATDGTLWAGTGADGRVLRVRPGQPEETVFQTPETNVFAIAVAGARVYAATGPNGKVYAIEADGTSRPFFDPQEKYIWALAVDGQNRLWVGAGTPAVIYRVDPSGTSQVVYKPAADHVVTLVRDTEGRMLAGTESPGRLYRFDAADHPFVLLDSGLAEVAAIAPDSTGVIFAAGVARAEDSSAGSGGGENAAVAATLSASAPATPSSGSASPNPRRSVLFRIAPDGTWEDIWATTDVVYDLAAQSDGSVLAATGPDGRLFQIDRNRDVFLMTGVDAKQITRFATDARTRRLTAFATANPGRVIAVGTGQQSPASYVSAVRDTKSVATWGMIRWEGAGAVALYTRSGNTDKPDDTWSAWSGPYTHAAGDAVSMPPARFFQWRAVFDTPAAATPPQLSSVTVAYLPRNSRPTVTSITIHPPGVVFQRPYAQEDGAIAGLDDATADARRAPGDSGPPQPAPGRRMFQKGLQTIAWRADDDDSDRLSYTLQYRREEDTTWKDLKTGLSDLIYVWDTTNVADGRYIIRVIASDAPSNSAERALSGDRESDPVEVDNTPPTLTATVRRQGNTSALAVHVHDARSPIQKLEYSLGGGNWQLVYPVDGLADSPDEDYLIPLVSDADANRIVLRATDALQNVASQPASVR